MARRPRTGIGVATSPWTPLVLSASRRARRSQSVSNLYLLGRAYALRFSDLRAQAKAAGEAGEVSRLEQSSQHDLANARSAYRDVLAKASRCYFAHHDLGVLELGTKRPDARSAFAHFVSALRINPSYTDARRKLILMYLQRNQHEQAAPQLAALLKQQPEDDVARMQYISSLSQLGRYPEAEAEVRSLLAKKPDRAAYRDLLAQVRLKQGHIDEALGLYRDLARANPSSAAPYVGMLRCIEALRASSPQVRPPVDYMLYALRGLHRLERDPAARKKLSEDIARVEAARHQPEVDPKQPITEDQVLRVLQTGPEEKDRARAIYWFVSRDKPVSPTAVRAIAGRIGPHRESAPGVRALAVRALGHVGGSAMLRLMRLALDDGDAAVRVATVDAMLAVGERDPRVRKAIVAILMAHGIDPDHAVDAARRVACLQLLGAHLDLPEEADDSMHRKAFHAWIHGAEAEDAIATGLEAYGRLNDRFPEHVALPFLRSKSAVLVKVAYELMAQEQRKANATQGQARSAWLALLPALGPDAWTPDALQATRQRLEAWRARAPGAR